MLPARVVVADLVESMVDVTKCVYVGHCFAAVWVMNVGSGVLDVAPLSRLLLQRPRSSDASGYRS